MPHVTFIHGIANKPEEAELLRLWRRALADGAQPLDLGDQGVTSSLVYWADVLYEKPDPDVAAHEGFLESTPQAIDASGGAAAPMPATPEEARFLAGLAAKLAPAAILEDAATEGPASPEATGTALERVPLPWFLKKRFLEAFLRDVHHYLFDVEHSPRPGTTYRVQDEIRRRFVAKLLEVRTDGKHVVLGHSMGTVIAYDCLMRVESCPKVDGLVTIGSPLGVDEIQDKLQPGWTRNDGFPTTRVAGAWANLFDRLDPVCGLDPELANDFRRSGASVVSDLVVQNDGAWRHSAGKYLRQPKLRAELRRLLDL